MNSTFLKLNLLLNLQAAYTILDLREAARKDQPKKRSKNFGDKLIFVLGF